MLLRYLTVGALLGPDHELCRIGEARAKATRIGSCKTLAAFAGAALRQALGLEPVETASSTPTPDASISQITILDAREYISEIHYQADASIESDGEPKIRLSVSQTLDTCLLLYHFA
ncbi:Unannotated [Lentimonas sp. CC19]|nr:Unannotated [Lentimonas sp. CC19]